VHVIKLKENFVLVGRLLSRVPLKNRDPAKKKLHEMEKFNLIRKATKATTWVNGMLAVHKAWDDVKICLILST
jgi:hypothetical protein